MSTKKKSSVEEAEMDMKEQDQKINNTANEEADSKNDAETIQISKLQEEVEREKDRYLRLFAEFENFKKRTARERIEMFKTAGEEIMVSMLPVLDDFDRALKEIEKSDDDNLFQGVKLISSKLRETLRVKGLQTIETQVGDDFNADTHEAITQIPAPEDKLKGKIIDVLEKGYALGDKIIRYPKVVIGQ
ncbi:nucleotide exchange factor GrpE [Aequorivita echinoideorum]|uniref:Protein GrpE n=1 Tax=Aequorivita echinoideorum TaxID=1549647 RepID=A0ABS5S754_9FLAO|nr:nucleotide exchange factor GrpE [Aequorivita echinoideorum]MBT0608250.1 nucleotide exchange factor GrpE [Aequorivita echinoideorum]